MTRTSGWVGVAEELKTARGKGSGSAWSRVKEELATVKTGGSAVVALEDRDALGRFVVGNEARRGGVAGVGVEGEGTGPGVEGEGEDNPNKWVYIRRKAHLSTHLEALKKHLGQSEQALIESAIAHYHSHLRL